MKDLLSGRHVMPSAKIDNSPFAFPLSITFISITVTSRAAALMLKTQMSGFTNNEILTLQPTLLRQWEMRLQGGGLSITLPLTSFLPLDPAPTRFQQRIKQLLTEG